MDRRRRKVLRATPGAAWLVALGLGAPWHLNHWLVGLHVAAGMGFEAARLWAGVGVVIVVMAWAAWALWGVTDGETL